MSDINTCMMQKLKAEIKKRPGLYALAKKIYIPREFFNRLMRPAIAWPWLRSLSPISKKYGFDRGKPIDRYYIEKFLQYNTAHIHGICLEVKDNEYTVRYGREVERADILDINPKNTKATIHDDLRALTTIPSSSYDCIILTQVLQFIDNYKAAISECYRVLKPEGYLLVTVPFLSRIDIGAGGEGDFWRFTKASTQYIFEKYFPKNNLEINSWGNVLVGLGFWVGLAIEDLPRRKFDYNDPNFPLIISVAAKK